MVSTMIVAAPAQNNSVRTRREEAKLRRTIRDIVWERRGFPFLSLTLFVFFSPSFCLILPYIAQFVLCSKPCLK